VGLKALWYGALFHDIGKIGVPDSILHNTDELTEEEWGVIRQHTVVGERIIRPVGFLRHIAPIVRHSHEHWDGSGYPDGLRGRLIPIGSRIILACDAYGAMTTERPYRAALTPADAVAELRARSGTQFDPQIVTALLDLLGHA
jgi:HD-GYP domain-containing protein (c-di-GMP phosphodiesterase class II)